MLAIRAYLLVDYQVNAEATPDSIPPAHDPRTVLVNVGRWNLNRGDAPEPIDDDARWTKLNF
jgi:hypothetical protein